GFVKWKVRLQSGVVRGPEPDRCLPKVPWRPHLRRGESAGGLNGSGLWRTPPSPFSTSGLFQSPLFSSTSRESDFNSIVFIYIARSRKSTFFLDVFSTTSRD